MSGSLIDYEIALLDRNLADTIEVLG